jgi:hypothetical protein
MEQSHSTAFFVRHRLVFGFFPPAVQIASAIRLAWFPIPDLRRDIAMVFRTSVKGRACSGPRAVLGGTCFAAYGHLTHPPRRLEERAVK